MPKSKKLFDNDHTETASCLRELSKTLEHGAASTHELNEVRATLLVNFGMNSDRNEFLIPGIQDEGTTSEMLVHVLSALIARVKSLQDPASAEATRKIISA